jgi:hypothetical protein
MSSDRRVNIINELVATILLFKCAALLNPNTGYYHFPATRAPAPRPPPLLHHRRLTDCLPDRRRVHTARPLLLRVCLNDAATAS